MNRFLFIVFFIVAAPCIAQQQDEQLAAQYFSNNEIEKAVDLYEKLYNKGSKSSILYENLLTCYFKLQRYDEAEKIVKKQQKRTDQSLFYTVDLGYVYEKANQPDKAKKVYDELINKMTASYDKAVELGNAFKRRGKAEYAIQTYVKARKLNGNNLQLFSVDLAQLYAEKKQTALMLEEYLNAILNNPALLDEVQGYLQLYLDDEKDYDLLKQTLLKNLKTNPANELYSDMLIWLYVQRKDFENALFQTRALDKRYKEEGKRIVQLADLMLINQSYDAATKAYNEVVLMGPEKPYYLNAKFGILRSRNQKIFYSGNYTQADLNALETAYFQFLKEFGIQPFTASSIRELAHLQAYYLYKYDSAIINFNTLIDMPRLDNRFKAECKLDLGDIYVLKGDVWDAMLLYGQVDKDFLEDPLGQEAKFRNAKLSYYIGEFGWAKAQLDVLKTATTQLIANNAMELSLQIQDNTIDSNEEPLRWFSRADLYYFQNRLSDALITLDSIQTIYPKHELADDVLFKRGEIALKKKGFAQAMNYFEQVVKEYGSGILGDNALFLLGDIAQSKLNNIEQAQKYYEQFIEAYPSSFYLVEVRKRYRALRGDITN